MKKFLEKNKIFGSLLSYSFFFLVLIFVIGIIFYNKSFIWNNDNINGILNTMVYYRDVLISFMESGKLSFYTWNIGLGSNMLPSLIWMIGDIFSYFSVCVAKNDLIFLYQVSLVVRLYLVGISFIIYSKYKKISNQASVIGALIYTFSIFSFYFLINNPYIFNVMILLPLLMIGIEKVVNDNKKIYFMVIAFLISFTNIYFIPIIFIYILLYSSILIFDKYYEYGLKLVLIAYLRVIGSYLIGVLMTGFLLIPVIWELFNYNISLFGNSDISYFKDLFLSYLVSNYNDVFIGINSIFLLYLPLGFKKFKENKNMIILLILLMLFLILFNGFNYSNYLGFIPLLVFSCIIAKTIDLYVNITKSDVKWIVSFIIINLLIVLIPGSNISNVVSILVIVLILLLVLLNRKELFNLFNKFDVYPVVFNLVFSLGIAAMIFTFYQEDKDYVDDSDGYFVSYDEEITDFEDSLAFVKDDKSFYRITSDKMNLSNIALYYDFKSINGSVLYTDNLYKDLSLDLANYTYEDEYYGNFNNRTKINSLLSTKYYIAEDSNYVSDGYIKQEEFAKYQVYSNNYYVNFGAFYDQYISLEEYNNLNVLEKEDSLMHYVVLEDKDINSLYVQEDDNYKDVIDKEIYKIEYKLETNDDGFIIDIFDNDYDGELYLRIVNFKAQEEVDLEVSHKNIVYNKTITEASEILVNLRGYSKVDGLIKVNFSKDVDYSYDLIELYVVDCDSLGDVATKLNSSNFEVIEMDSNSLKAKVNASKSGLLQFSTSYRDNFEVLVDGEKVDTLQVNKYFLGIYLDSGEHIVEVRYKTLGSVLGICGSILGIVLFIFTSVLETKKTI